MIVLTVETNQDDNSEEVLDTRLAQPKLLQPKGKYPLTCLISLFLRTFGVFLHASATSVYEHILCPSRKNTFVT